MQLLHREYYTQFLKENYRDSVPVTPFDPNNPSSIFLFNDTTRTALCTTNKHWHYAFVLILIYRH